MSAGSKAPEQTPAEAPEVLCIEDDPAAGLLIKRGLERAGYRVEVVTSGGEGLTQFAARRWAVVMVDNQLPDMSGLEVLEAMALHGPLPATIMVTGRGSEHIVVSAFKAGAHDYLVKDAAETYLELLPEVVGRARDLVQQRELALALEKERERLIAELSEALAKIKTLSGLIPICAACKSIRNDEGFWESLEAYLTAHSDAMLTHGLCPTCLPRYFP